MVSSLPHHNLGVEAWGPQTAPPKEPGLGPVDALMAPEHYGKTQIGDLSPKRAPPLPAQALGTARQVRSARKHRVSPSRTFTSHPPGSNSVLEPLRLANKTDGQNIRNLGSRQ